MPQIPPRNLILDKTPFPFFTEFVPMLKPLYTNGLSVFGGQLTATLCNSNLTPQLPVHKSLKIPKAQFVSVLSI